MKCGDCRSFSQCEWLVQAKADWEKCDWEPSRFMAKQGFTLVTEPEDLGLGKLYRYDESRGIYGDVKIGLTTFPIIKVTKCGVWIRRWALAADKTFVLRDAHKRFAYPTKEEALTSFIARKSRQIRIVSNQLKVAEEALRLALEMQRGGEKTDDHALPATAGIAGSLGAGPGGA